MKKGERVEAEVMDRESIYNSIKYVLFMAQFSTDEPMFWLEKLPRSVSDYDTEVNDYIKKLKFFKRKSNRVSFNATVDELVEHYFINQEEYEF